MTVDATTGLPQVWANLSAAFNICDVKILLKILQCELGWRKRNYIQRNSHLKIIFQVKALWNVQHCSNRHGFVPCACTNIQLFVQFCTLYLYMWKRCNLKRFQGKKKLLYKITSQKATKYVKSNNYLTSNQEFLHRPASIIAIIKRLASLATKGMWMCVCMYVYECVSVPCTLQEALMKHSLLLKTSKHESKLQKENKTQQNPRCCELWTPGVITVVLVACNWLD